jgi:hypothetical protein
MVDTTRVPRRALNQTNPIGVQNNLGVRNTSPFVRDSSGENRSSSLQPANKQIKNSPQYINKSGGEPTSHNTSGYIPLNRAVEEKLNPGMFEPLYSPSNNGDS